MPEATSDLRLAALLIDMKEPHGMAYEFGEPDDGLKKILEVVIALRNYGVPTIATEYRGFPIADCLKEQIPQEMILQKPAYNAFDLTDLDERLGDANTLIIMGFNRHCCVWKTAEGARAKGYRVLTCPELMLSLPKEIYWRETESGLFYATRTTRMNIQKMLRTIQQATPASHCEAETYPAL